MTAGKGQINLQDVFINHVRRERIAVVVYIKDGKEFSGYVDGFDSFTIILTIENNQILIYKHAVSAIIPSTPVALFSQNK